MEEKEVQKIATEDFSQDYEASDELTLEEIQVGESGTSKSPVRLDQKQKIILKTLTAFLLLAIGVLLGGLFIYLNEDEVSEPAPQINFQLGEAPVQNPGEEPVVAVAKAVSPSVVLVEIPGLGQGSGIVLDSEGHIVTNGHVVDEAESVLVTLSNGRKIEATVIGSDIRRDVAVVKLDDTVPDLIPATFAPSDDIQVGQLAVAVGSPFDLSQTVTSGIVSALGRVVSSYGCEVGGFNSAECAGISTIQTDAPINPGNSGGPLADRYGRVIGMNTLIYTGGIVEGNVGVGFALPSDTVVLVSQRLIAGEPVGTAWLGIRGESPDDGRGGAIIVELTQGSPADQAGLQVGDLIVASEGRPIITMESLRADIQLQLPGMTVTLDYEREGVLSSTEVILGDLDKFLAEP
ncbi:MAG TPA: trypsin-like peptidase domain-containing protein [Acidimicrobiales bacterium]|nr:trypsin-like peptidase domain-containing protein [Acidimicrobiales bacterium]|tara:strand:+ start:225 stop:1439 length:1215 start_codon:yes stop_codon:yes gene_type:complete